MRCTKCGTEGRDGQKFCAECGNRLANHCANCNSDNAPEAKFCVECGQPLNPRDGAPIAAGTTSDPVSASTRDPAAVQAPEVAGERRHLTVLFSDLVGSTAIAAQLDPEEWRETVSEYHRLAADAIARFGGHVVKYLGDGVMALFGWPAAHDNDAERAARAGLAIIDALAKLGAGTPSGNNSGRPPLAVRVGLDSGPVVMGKGAGGEVDVFGDAANIAARVETAADPGTVLITAATQRLVSGLFAVEERGPQQLKGIEVPIQLYRVIQPSGVRGRLEATAAVRGLTPFVGREDESRLLMNRWERTLNGDGQVALIVGEAGLGKSRLVQRFHEQIAGTPHTWIQCATAPFYQNTPFYPVVEVLRQLVWERSLERLDDYLHELQGKQPPRNRTSLRDGDPIATANEQFAQLESALALAGLEATEALPLIAPLLNLTLPPELASSSLPADQQRRRLLATLVEWMLGAARAQPLVIVTEDLHWADPSTLELIQTLVEQGARSSLLLLYTARPEFKVPWPLRAHHTQINLNRLGVRDVREMIEEVAAQKAMTAETVAAVVERTGGVPLFVEELTRAVLERGGEGANREIPATLHDSLMARLDRLGTSAKEVAQVASVIGREFSYALLHALHPLAEEDLQSALAKLADAELVYARGIAPDATYTFKHALIQDAAYEALLKTRRRELHRKVAQAITQEFTVLAEAHPEVLGRHWTEAGEIALAIDAWTKAGNRAVERRAYREGEQHYGSALSVLQNLPESDDRDTREFPLQLAVGRVMEATRGWSAADTVAVYARARSLAKRGGRAESLQIFNGLYSAAITRDELRPALALAEQMLEIVRGIGSPLDIASAHYAKALALHYLGDLTGARHQFLQVIEHYREEGGRGVADDPGVNSRIFAGHNEWHLGYPDRGVRYAEEATSMARRRNNPALLAFALSAGSYAHELRGDFERSLKAGEEAVNLATESQFPLLKAVGKIRIGRARAQMGEAVAGVEQIREALSEFNVLKFYLARASFLVYLSEAQALAGAISDAVVTVEQALQFNPDELVYRSNILCLRAELNLKSAHGRGANFEFAERDFREAIEVARRIVAKSPELRATMSLSRLLRETNRRNEARAMLADIYGWFTEGFDTTDLKDAKALLEELGP